MSLPQGILVGLLQTSGDLWFFATACCAILCVILSFQDGRQDLTQVRMEPASSSRLPLRHTSLSPTASGLPKIGSRSYLISPVAPTCAPLRSRDPLEHPSCLLLPFPPHPQASQTDRGRRITDRATGRPDGTDHRVEGAGKEKDGVGARQTVRGRAYV